MLVYFAGHGFVCGGQGLSGAVRHRAGQIATTGYPMATLGSTCSAKIKAKWKVLLTDSCHSGAVTPEDDAAPSTGRCIDLTRSLFSLTASRDRERSFESPDWGGGHGIFTYYVVRGPGGRAPTRIATASSPPTNWPSTSRRNVREATGRQAESHLGPQQLRSRTCCWPMCPRSAAAGAPPPPKFGALIVEVEHGRRGGVPGRQVGGRRR